MLRIVSTFNPTHWEPYVRGNIESWLKYTTADIVLYYEGNKPELVDERVQWRDWSRIPGALSFRTEASCFPPANGRFGQQKYNYNYDAVKFCHKVYAQLDCISDPGSYLIWLDSDVTITQPLMEAVIEKLMDGKAVGTFWRKGYHPETGVVVFNRNHPAMRTMANQYANLYETRNIFRLPRGWHDCWALAAACAVEDTPVADFTNKHTKEGVLHVVPESELGKYLTHAKGNRKHGIEQRGRAD
jgi:hypothetical protein